MASTATAFPNISGGLPTSKDYVPSIIFTVMYGMLFPSAVWRIISYRKSLLWTYIRLFIFSLVRFTTFILRTVEAHAADPYDPDLGIFIAEQILLGIGFIVLVALLVDFVKSHLTRTDVPPDVRPVDQASPQWQRITLTRVVRFMHIALIAAVALGIAAGSSYYQATQNPSVAAQTKSERIASTVICLVVTALAAAISLLLLLTRPLLPQRSSAYLLAVSCILLIIPAYRLSSLTNTPSLETLVSSQTKAEFWVLQALMEWIGTVMFLAVDVRQWFGAGVQNVSSEKDTRAVPSQEGVGTGVYA